MDGVKKSPIFGKNITWKIPNAMGRRSKETFRSRVEKENSRQTEMEKTGGGLYSEIVWVEKSLDDVWSFSTSASLSFANTLPLFLDSVCSTHIHNHAPYTTYSNRFLRLMGIPLLLLAFCLLFHLIHVSFAFYFLCYKTSNIDIYTWLNFYRLCRTSADMCFLSFVRCLTIEFIVSFWCAVTSLGKFCALC